MKSKKEIKIYNLEFPPYINELKIGEYKFKRINKYEEAYSDLMHLVNSSGSEYSTKVKTGIHQITAIAEIPDKEKECVLPWENKKMKELDDVLFLLTLFTGRNVFKKDWKDEEGMAIVQDHRLHHFGGQLLLSIKYETRLKQKKSGKVITEKQLAKKIEANLDQDRIYDYNRINIGFEKTLNKILKTISSKEWQKEYEGGYFLFLFRSAVQRQIIETSFLLCWTIWEHIFAIKNRSWLDDRTIEQMSGEKKICFILNSYFLKNIDEVARRNILKINKTRNRLVHFGKRANQAGYKEMDMFIRLTEQLMAIVLGLSPSNVFNSFEQLDGLLNAG